MLDRWVLSLVRSIDTPTGNPQARGHCVLEGSLGPPEESKCVSDVILIMFKAFEEMIVIHKNTN